MTEELANLVSALPRAPQNELGHTIVATTQESTSSEVLDLVKEVWAVVAAWGRWCDDALGEWPNRAAALAALPEWFRTSFQGMEFEFDNWISDLHDREWIWGNGYIKEDRAIRVDLVTYAYPISTWTLEYLLEKAGTVIVYSDVYLSEQ